MFECTIDVSSRDTDSLGHVNNTSIPLWFETARNPFYKIFNPDLKLDPKTWNLIMVHTEFDYIDQIFYGKKVIIKTYVYHIGNTSCTTYQEVWQEDKLKSTGKATLVYFDFNKQEKVQITDDLKQKLEKHLYQKE